ncbi:hypothetical protein R3P38DRAFT_2794458 [Favolaschia claudopus]|uniref:Uncharacterized protein n=1 Tax=Favolaschia claudopus TaxID=2862362 RepID=A0AAW0A9Y6_9AGAR
MPSKLYHTLTGPPLLSVPSIQPNPPLYSPSPQALPRAALYLCDVPASFPCTGVPLLWDTSTFWSTYPFHVHDPASKYNPGYQLISLNPAFIRSFRCLGTSQVSQAPCSRCSILPLEVEELRDRAKEPYDYVRVEERLNHDQLRQKATYLKGQINDLKLEALNRDRSLVSAREDIVQYKEIIQFIGTNYLSVRGLHRIFPNALKKGWSPSKLLERIQASSEGEYVPENYAQDEIDLTILLYELGGGSAVYAMNHSIFALPSLNTIQPYRRQHRIKPCLDHVDVRAISDNISAMFGPHEVKGGLHREAPVKRCLHTMMFDEIAMDREVGYMPTTDEMAGFCLEHVAALDSIVVGKDTKTVEAAVDAVKNGKVHIAHEATVGAIAHLSKHDYGAKPILVSPSCKKGSWRGMLETMLSVLESWNHSPDGAAKHGDIALVASDGDQLRRVALFMLCMHSEILPGNPLYPLICNLPGFNRRVGKNNLVMDMDYRHMFKRICTLICSYLGMLVKGICINRDMLVLWFERLSNHDWSETSIENLLHPTDAQNVSRAVKLLLCIIDIQTIDKESLDPSEEAEFEALCLLGEVFKFLVHPFIIPSLSLSEQITSLVTFAHLACGLYLQNGTSFMSNQLYGDLQATIKAAIIMVARTQLEGPLLEVLICLLGDNPVEILFGRTRMKGGHSPNSGTLELLIRLCSAMNLDDVFNHHPELERKARRLKLIRARDLDHVGPKQWRGDITAGSCNIQACWEAGVQAAERILREHSVSEPKSFKEHFRKKDTDLLRPFGGKYPALSPEIDRSIAIISTTPESTESAESELPINTVDSAVNPVAPGFPRIC